MLHKVYRTRLAVLCTPHEGATQMEDIETIATIEDTNSGDLQGLGWIIVVISILVIVGMASPRLAKTTQQSTDISYRSVAYKDAQDANIDPTLFVRQINQESGFNPHAVSPAGAIGIAQFMPSTAVGLGIDPHDPIQALKAASHLMASYIAIYGTYGKALACYNAGCTTLDRAMQNCSDYYYCLPSETQNYIVAIMGYAP
jgi:soluble lytic murein transglycosylase-like protein